MVDPTLTSRYRDTLISLRARARLQLQRDPVTEKARALRAEALRTIATVDQVLRVSTPLHSPTDYESAQELRWRVEREEIPSPY
jgi:hypothetical protein